MTAPRRISGIAQQQIERERRDVVGDRIERRIVALMQYLHVAAAGFAGFGLDRCRSAGNLLIGNALGRAAQRAFDARVIPQRAAQRAGAEARGLRTTPADDHVTTPAALPQAGQAPSPTGTERFGVELRREPGEMHLEHRSDEHVLGQRVDWYRVRQDGADHRRLGDGIGRFDALQRKARAVRHRDVVGHRQKPLPRRIEGVVAP